MKTNTAYAIYILWLRQIKRYFRSKSRIVGSLGQPILFLVALGYGLNSVFAASGQGNYIQFLAPGIIGMSILFTAIFSGIEIIWDRQFGFLKETLVAPVSRFTIMFGRTLGGATTASLQGILVLVISLFIGFHPNWAGLIPALIIMVLIALVFTALGTAIASRLEDMQGFQLIMNFLVMPIFFLSGALFPLTNLPAALAVLTSLDPLSYGIDGLRNALIAAVHFGFALDTVVLCVVASIFLALSTFCFSRIEI